MNQEKESPAFAAHRVWVEKLVDTPSPAKFGHLYGKPALTSFHSPTEHVLRGSRSFAARSWKSRASANSLRVPSNKENRSTNASESDRHPPAPLPSKAAPVLGEIAPNNQALRVLEPWRVRQSPTPSLRKKKIESLVQAHGSPPHVRVTAGGRIVPSEQSPLCHPRYGYSAIRTNGGLIKFAPNHPTGNAQWTQATQNGFVAQDVQGRLCQIVDGTILPLNEVNGSMQLFMPAPNLSITQRGASHGPTPSGPPQPPSNISQRNGSHLVPPEPSTAAQINALELEYSKLDFELKDVDKTEVLHGRTMGKAAKEALVGKRRELVITMDKLRKALKGLKQQAPPDAPTSPRATPLKQSASPPKSRLPPFLQQRQNQQMAPPHAVYGPYYGVPQPGQFGPPYSFQPTPSPDASFGPQPWGMPPPGMFPQPPPPFDGSTSSAALPPQPEPFRPSPAFEQQPQQPGPVGPSTTTLPPATERRPLGHDSRSSSGINRISLPNKSRAVPIIAPDGKLIKSSLNPMSPAYKPGTRLLKSSESDRGSAKSVKDRVLTPLSPLPHMQPPSGSQLRVVNKTDETITPTKKDAHLHSSSVSSFETADFFPRNTKEYSSRTDAYSARDDVEEKENCDPQPCDGAKQDIPIAHAEQACISHAHPAILSSNSQMTSPVAGPVAPPSTPADPEVARQRLLSGTVDSAIWDEQGYQSDVGTLPDRNAHNISPKNKRKKYVFVEEHPDLQASSSPRKPHACQDELCVTSSPYENVEFAQKPLEFVKGYQAGLNRNPPGHESSADFLKGYCAALMKQETPNTPIVHSTGSPIKPVGRRPSPVSVQPPAQSSALSDRRQTRPTLAPIEISRQSPDSLKQAMLAPQNENAVLTPAPDGPHINEAAFGLGQWAKEHRETMLPEVDPTALQTALAGFQFPKRSTSVKQHQQPSIEETGPNDETVSMLHGQDNSQHSQEPLLQNQRSGNEMPPQPASPSISAKSAPLSTGNATDDYRVSSLTSIDSTLYLNYPGNRVFSPHLEFKSASSVARHAGLASGFFAQAQYDGAAAPQTTQRPLSMASTDSAAPPKHPRFFEGSIDGMSDPPNSPPPTSPTASPKATPSKDKAKDPTTKGSPARAKFELIAEKVGIKTVGGGKEKDVNESNSSPQGKRRWRDVWRAGPRKEASKDEQQQTHAPPQKGL
ncbi:hypothetical protein B0A50_00589 [Salinomyces thailandicus]|uniref:Uncharacterized protein n=1 Tax=Salinomyces thailandicus TaxID=706561 RepID=A0A4U0UE23_9PEZI|nr:hypothetical protein B0A50_00589 [Salinomyces thailandica]